jgi:hypothetical protein
MGTVSNTTGWVEASEPPAVSRGKNRRTVTADISLSDSYATGGDTISLPAGFGTLKALFVAPSIKGGYHLTWDGGTTTAKIIAYDLADSTAANIGAQPAATTDLSTVSVTVMAVFEK